MTDFNQNNSDATCQGIEMAPDSCLTTITNVVVYGLAAIGAVALCALAGFLLA